MKELLKNRYYLSLFLFSAVYLVGFASVLAGYPQELMTLTPYNLLFAGILLVYNARAVNSIYVFWFSLVALSGFLLEVVGVSTGLLFGEYTYGKTLGIKIFEVPLLIGLNWSLLVFGTAALVQGLRIHLLLKAALAATLMVIYDLLLEPVAIQYDFWNWTGGSIPLQNYLAWWLIAFGMLSGAFALVKDLRNKMAPWILGVQMLFFIVLLLLS